MLTCIPMMMTPSRLGQPLQKVFLSALQKAIGAVSCQFINFLKQGEETVIVQSSLSELRTLSQDYPLAAQSF